MICYYHNDMDGIASAAIIRQIYPDCIFKSVQYKDDWKMDEVKNKDVFVVDFSFKNMEELYKMCASLCWIDHHKTAKEKFPKLWDNNKEIYGIRDLNNSGCELTWKYFHKESEMPIAIKLIGDRDMWRFSYIETKPFNERLNTLTTNPNDDIWKTLLFFEKTNFFTNIAKVVEIVKEGNLLVDIMNKKLEKIFHKGNEFDYENFRCKEINSAEYISELGNYIIDNGFDIGIIWRQVQSEIVISLRSKGEVDVSKIAEKFGGGGHKNASGFSIKSFINLKDLLINMRQNDE